MEATIWLTRDSIDPSSHSILSIIFLHNGYEWEPQTGNLKNIVGMS